MDAKCTPKPRFFPPGDLGLVVLLVVAFGALNSAWMYWARYFLNDAFLGMLIGQLGFLAFWAVLGSQRPFARFCVALVGFHFLYGAAVVGTVLTGKRISTLDEELWYFFLLPLLFFIAQVPIFVLKRAWRLSPALCGREVSRPNVRGWLLATHALGVITYVGMAIGLVSVGITFCRAEAPMDADDRVWPVVLVACLATTVLSGLVGVPFIWAALVARRRWVATGSVFTLLFAGTILLNPLTLEHIVGNSLFLASMTGTLLLGLCVVRFCGYGVSRPKQKGRKPDDERVEPCDVAGSERQPYWYVAVVARHVTPKNLVIGLLVIELCLVSINRDSPWMVLLGVAVLLGAVLAGLAWFLVSLLWRRQFQFGIGTLLTLTVVVAIVAGWFSWKMQTAKPQREAVEAIAKLGGEVLYDYQVHPVYLDPISNAEPFGPKWLCNLVGVDFLADVVDVSVWEDVDADAVLAHVEDLTTLRVVFLRDTQVTDAGLVHLRNLHSLEQLWLSRTQVSDKGLQHLRDLPNLRSLNLGHTQVTDAGLVHLRGLSNLEYLVLRGRPISDNSLQHLRDLRNLTCLDLRDTQVTDAGLAYLGGLSNLEFLSLDRTQITDAGLEHLNRLEQLRSLGLGGTRVTDALLHLKSLKNLESIQTEDTRITEKGREELFEALPKLYIETGG